jgi:hypothetical protein
MKLTHLILACALVLAAPLVSAQSHPAGVMHGGDSGNLDMKAASPAQGAPGSPVNVRIEFTGMAKSGVAVTYRTEGGLALDGVAKKQLTPDSKGTAQDTVVVRAQNAGAYFLNVFAKSKGVTKVVSIPVTIGNAMFKPRTASSVATPQGERVIEMPAQQKLQ